MGAGVVLIGGRRLRILRMGQVVEVMVGSRIVLRGEWVMERIRFCGTIGGVVRLLSVLALAGYLILRLGGGVGSYGSRRKSY